MGSIAVGGGGVAVGHSAKLFGVEQRDPLVQFGVGIWCQIFGCEATRGVSDRSWAIGFFHWDATSRAKRLAVNRRDGYSPANRG